MGFSRDWGLAMGHCTVDTVSVVGGRKAGPVATDAVGKLMFFGRRCGTSYFLGKQEANLLAKKEE